MTTRRRSKTVRALPQQPRQQRRCVPVPGRVQGLVPAALTRRLAVAGPTRPAFALAVLLAMLLSGSVFSSGAQSPSPHPAPAPSPQHTPQPRPQSGPPPYSLPAPPVHPRQGTPGAYNPPGPGNYNRPGPDPHANLGGGVTPARPGQNPYPSNPRGQHLPQWMERHGNLNLQQQEQALRQEPGFNRLSQPQQQHLIDRLHKLDSAPPEVRQRILARNELFERMPPEQKQQIRGATQTLTQLPPDRNMAVRHAFRDLRGLPPDQRQAVLNSARFQAEYSPQERYVLGHLLSIEPYQP